MKLDLNKTGTGNTREGANSLAGDWVQLATVPSLGAVQKTHSPTCTGSHGLREFAESRFFTTPPHTVSKPVSVLLVVLGSNKRTRAIPVCRAWTRAWPTTSATASEILRPQFLAQEIRHLEHLLLLEPPGCPVMPKTRTVFICDAPLQVCRC